MGSGIGREMSGVIGIRGAVFGGEGGGIGRDDFI